VLLHGGNGLTRAGQGELVESKYLRICVQVILHD